MLERMSGLDAGFLYMETPTLHMHTLKVAIIAPGEASGPVSFEAFRSVLRKKLESLPAFRQRMVAVPFGLDHPAWATDPAFDLDQHVRYRCLASPGSQQQLDAVVSHIAGENLPRDRPLWEITMVDRLEGGRVAFVCKLHHSMADGNAALAMLLHVLRTPEDRAPVARESEASVSLPSQGDLIRFAAARALRRIAALPQLVMATVRGFLALRRIARQHSELDLPAAFGTPVTPFNAALTSDRLFATRTLPLADLKRAKRSLGVTLNDVVLGICGGALRAHLADAGALPELPLVAGVPINTRPEERGRLRGNHVGHLMCSLRTDIEDPVERIRAIHEITSAVKQRHFALGSDIMEHWFEYTPPRPFSAIAHWWSNRHVANWVRPPINLVVSTVPGSAETLWIGDARLEALYSVGPILEGIGLNITGWSYGDEMCFVALACPQHVPNLSELIDRLPVVLDELLQRCEPIAATLAEPQVETDAPSLSLQGDRALA